MALVAGIALALALPAGALAGHGHGKHKHHGRHGPKPSQVQALGARVGAASGRASDGLDGLAASLAPVADKDALAELVASQARVDALLKSLQSAATAAVADGKDGDKAAVKADYQAIHQAVHNLEAEDAEILKVLDRLEANADDNFYYRFTGVRSQVKRRDKAFMQMDQYIRG